MKDRQEDLLSYKYYNNKYLILFQYFLKVPVSPPDLSVKRPNLKRSKTLGLSSIDNNSYNLEVKSPLSNGKTIILPSYLLVILLINYYNTNHYYIHTCVCKGFDFT